VQARGGAGAQEGQEVTAGKDNRRKGFLISLSLEGEGQGEGEIGVTDCLCGQHLRPVGACRNRALITVGMPFMTKNQKPKTKNGFK
jgi:hypothetical protein